VLGTCGPDSTIPGPVRTPSEAREYGLGKIAAIETQRAKETSDFNTFLATTNQYRFALAKGVIDTETADEIAASILAECKSPSGLDKAENCFQLLTQGIALLHDADGALEEAAHLGSPSSTVKLGENLANDPLDKQATLRSLADQLSQMRQSAVKELITGAHAPPQSSVVSYCHKISEAVDTEIAQGPTNIQNVRTTFNIFPLDLADSRVVALIALLNTLGNSCVVPPATFQALLNAHLAYKSAGSAAAGYSAPVRVSTVEKRCSAIPEQQREVEYLKCVFIKATPALVARLGQ
jgi:hypothetical protein